MKLSNKILIGFFGFLFLYLTAAFTELRLTGSPNFMDNNNSITETADYSGISYLKLNHCDQDLKVMGSDRFQIQVRSVSGDLLKKLKYNVSGDTLVISGFEAPANRRVEITVFVPRSGLKGISNEFSTLLIEGLNQELLQVSQNAGRTWMSDNRISKMVTHLSNESLLEISTTSLDTLSGNLEESRMYITSPVGLVECFMKNSSFLELTEVDEIQLRKDGSSKLKIFQQM